MNTIGLIAAMRQEQDALLRTSSDWRRLPAGLIRGYSNQTGGRRLILVTSGMGMKRASISAGNLVENGSVDYLISFGIAGAVENDLAIGDVILIERVCALENGTAGKCVPLQNWSALAFQEAEQELQRRGVRLYRGTAVTTDGSQVFGDQLEGLEHPVLEMETMGIAQVAAEKGIPFLAVRAISDGPTAPIPFDLGEMMDKDANLQIGKLFKMVIRRPQVLVGLSRMMKNSRFAEDNAAVTLMELVRQTFVSEGLQ
jgi:nucleoside phosphorylase